MPEAIISAKGTEAPTVRSGRFTRMLLHPASLVVPMTDIGPARGGAGTPSPLWCDRGEFAEDGDMHLTQVVGQYARTDRIA